MNSASNIVPVKMPTQSGYGAIELKKYINRYTIRAFLYTLAGLILLMLIYFTFVKVQAARKAPPKLAPISKIRIEDLPPQDMQQQDQLPPPPQTEINTGPAARAGTPVPVPDAQITPDMKEFATVDVMSRASAEGGNGVDLGGFAPNIDFDAKKEVKVQVKEQEPAPDEFIAAEKYPETDMVKLQKSVEYPELARRAGIEGQVIIRVLVDGSGKIKKTLVEYSDNEMLNNAAINAIKGATFTPAIQNGQPIQCWVSIPIKFKLR